MRLQLYTTQDGLDALLDLALVSAQENASVATEPYAVPLPALPDHLPTASDQARGACAWS